MKAYYLVFFILLSTSIILSSQGMKVSAQEPVGPANGNRISVDFEHLSSLTSVNSHYSNIGVTFEGATILTQGQSLNYLNFPPRSGINVVYDDPSSMGTINVYFNASVTGNVSKVGSYVTGNRNVTMTAYDAGGNALGAVSTGGANFAPGGVPNKLLEIISGSAIAKVTFFNGGERGNTYTLDDFYFDTNQTCQIANVPLYKQESPAWAGDLYGGTTANPWTDPTGVHGTIGRWGCALTATAMIVSYYGLQQNGFTTNPHDLNAWLKAWGGYSGGDIIWGKVAEYGQKVGGIQLYYYSGWNRDDGVVNAFVCSLFPVILATSTAPYGGGHYVLATGQAGSAGWSVNDPGPYNWSQVSSSSYTSIRRYGNSPKEPKSLYIAAHSPLQLLITDPAGRQTGYDANTGQTVNTIVDSNYGVETLGAGDGSGAEIQTLVFETTSPLTGTYSVQLVGTGNGSFEVDFTAYDTGGAASSASISGTITTNTKELLNLNFPGDPGSQIVVAHKNNTYLPYIGRNMGATPLDTYEPNNTLAEAYGSLSAGKVYTSYISSNADRDYYYFDISTLGQIAVDLTNIDAPYSDYDLQLFDAAGRSLAYSGGITTSERIVFQPVTTGRYYALVYPYAGANASRPYYLSAAYDGALGDGDIFGTVRTNGTPRPDTPMSLDSYDSNTGQFGQIGTLTTGAGEYHLHGLPTLNSGQSYYAYYNGNLGPSYVGYWRGPTLTSYAAGTSVSAGDLDLSALNLGTPNTSTGISLPVTFNWQARATSPSETYRLYLYDPSNPSIYFWSDDLGHASDFLLSALPAGFALGHTNQWRVYAFNNGGSGSSYYRNTVVFATSTANSVNSAHWPAEQVVIVDRPDKLPSPR